MSDTDFYRAFEDRYRGSRELIKSRLEVYLPFALPLKEYDSNCQGVDLGCGRGEWLELMQENALDVQGVDLDQGMLDVARERGLNVAHGDAIKSLQSMPDESQMLISGFHLAEHLPFDVLQVLIEESLRVLRPGGLIILETPNPENILVGAANFYLDPTHQRPIPFQLLSFMFEYAGFERFKVLRLQDSAELKTNDSLSLLDVLSGVSPDYAVVAQKGGAPELVSALNLMFEADYGISLEYIANRFHQQAEAKAQQAESKAEQAEAKAQQAEAKAQQAEAKSKAEQAEAKAQIAVIIAWQKSLSWILILHTFIQKNLVQFPETVRTKIKNKIKLILAHTKLFINQRPRLRHTIITSSLLRSITKWAVKRYPRLGLVVKNLMGVNSFQLNVRSFNSLASVKIMRSMADSLTDTTNSDSVIFLQLTHEE